MVIQRAGDDGNAFHAFCGPSVDGEFFAYMVVYGFFFILLTQIIGIIFGDKPSVTVTSFNLLHCSNHICLNTYVLSMQFTSLTFFTIFKHS